MYISQMTSEDLEFFADVVKARVLSALVAEGALNIDFAEEWASTHTVLKRKKGFFRTLTDKWTKQEEEASTSFCIVVKEVRG